MAINTPGAVLLFYISVAVAVASYTADTWVQRGGDAVLYTKILDNVHADSPTQCGVQCYQLPACFGYDFSESDRECVLHDGAAMTLVTPQSVSRGEERWQNFGMPELFCDSNGVCLMFVATAKTVAEARAYCQSLRMDLAAGQTAVKLNFADSVRQHVGLTDLKQFWLSGSDEGHEGNFVWVNTGESFSSTENLWGGEQPDNAGGYENCVEWGAESRVFNDLPCTSELPFICEP